MKYSSLDIQDFVIEGQNSQKASNSVAMSVTVMKEAIIPKNW